ncbi:MAG: phosphoadenosine phosphosulfate reductase family protein [Candidatus Lokiarchaeota archaeon]|nr:phosphoadenosine phosphosulfate reductase family protein [Candidatus Lokiarchaeota archaeon]
MNQEIDLRFEPIDLFYSKLEHAKDLIRDSIKQFPKIAVACSFGKDSMVVVDIARKVDFHIPIFAIMTIHKPKETFEYLIKMNELMHLNVKVYIVADQIPRILKDANIETVLLPADEYNRESAICRKEIYVEKPDLCCDLLKVHPTRVAVKDLDAWCCGLRNTEGRTRLDYEEIENKGGLYKINPILTFTEEEVFQYLHNNGIPLHPWYEFEFEDGRRYRSLGCATCTKPIYPEQLEREGRWINTSKCGGECGIHTKYLK